MSSSKIRSYGSAAGLVAAGLVAGGVLATSMSANAADGTPSPSPTARPANPNPGDPGRPQRSDERPLTGDTLAKVKAAVLKKYPGATFQRVETDSDGVYEAHITKADGTRTTVELDKHYAITGEEQGRGGRPGRGHGCPPPPEGSQPG